MSEEPTLFDGETFDPEHDGPRLSAQLARVKEAMMDHHWHTLAELALRANGSEAGVSARLRDLRKTKFGGYVVEHRRKENCEGVWEYRIPERQIDWQTFERP